MMEPPYQEVHGLGTVRSFLQRSLRAIGKDWQPVIWLIGLTIGVLTAYAVIGFRLLIAGTQWVAFGTPSHFLFTALMDLSWWHILLMPAIGGLVVGFLLHRAKVNGALPDEHAHGVAEVIEARGLRGGRISLGTGFYSAVIAAISLGAGGSAGREGPAVHLGAALSSQIAQRLGYAEVPSRTFLACGAAAAVSASFNAPIAGVLFALEVVLGHYALSVFAPVVIASVTAAIITRVHLGEFPAFLVPAYEFGSYWQLPAFALLGLVSGAVAILFMKTSIFAEYLTNTVVAKWSIPLWLRPALAGLLVGAIAVFFPHVLGVGYQSTDAALKGLFPFWVLITLIGAKIVATALTLAGRFGGGVFSPALYLGAMTGGAFGIIAGTLFPDLSATEGLYAIIGMGAVSAAILGAPISTTLIAFELVRKYEVSIALMVSVSIATLLTQAVVGKSFFHWQIERRGYRLREGPQDALLHLITVRDVMTAESEESEQTVPGGAPALTPSDTLKTIFALMDREKVETLPVVDPADRTRRIGLVRRSDCLTVYNHALIQAHVESHR